MLIFLFSKRRYGGYLKTWWNMFVYFPLYEISGLCLHSSIFSIVYSRSEQIGNCTLSILWYWLVSLEGIIILQKYLFSHTFLCNLTFFPVTKEWRELDHKNHCDV